MSLLIKGDYKIPDCCENCFFGMIEEELFPNPEKNRFVITCKITREEHDYGENYHPKNCPLSEV